MPPRVLIPVWSPRHLPLAVFWVLAPMNFASAQTVGFTSGQMWGASSQSSAGGATVSSESAALHTANGMVAGSVNAAAKGLLLGGATTITIQSIGAQTVISTNVIGDNNGDVHIEADQSADNSGDTTTNGSVSATQ
jgi:hypothetical protein